MYFKSDYKFLGWMPITTQLQELTETVKKLDWTINDFSRDEAALSEGKYLSFPFVVTSKKDDAKYDYITKDLCSGIIEQINTLYPDCVYVRGEIAALLPGVQVLPHIDGKWFHKFSHRVHVPLYTNDKCNNVFNSNEKHFELYSIYEINNRILHHAYNNGTEPRIHLIFDVMPRQLYESTTRSVLFSKA